MTIYRGELVIVEVKSMEGNIVNLPSEVVDLKKQMNLVRAADAFIRYHNWKKSTRFDVIAVRFCREGFDIEHIENAFYPEAE